MKQTYMQELFRILRTNAQDLFSCSECPSKLRANKSVTAATLRLAVSCRVTSLAVTCLEFDNASVIGKGKALQCIHILHYDNSVLLYRTFQLELNVCSICHISLLFM